MCVSASRTRARYQRGRDVDNGGLGGESDEEDGEVFIDITDDEPEVSKEEQIENNTKEAKQETEEDIKETLKSMLSDDEDDDDIEFIDID